MDQILKGDLSDIFKSVDISGFSKYYVENQPKNI